MSYRCVDRGTDKCPCILMEAGQCYTCGMIQHGKCDCPGGWQGVCPYTEYVQNGRKSKPLKGLDEYRVIDYEVYSPTLTVITVEASDNTWVHYGKIGAFCMFKWQDWFIPVSVLSCGNESVGESICGGTVYTAYNAYRFNDSNQVVKAHPKRGFVKFAINASGPKTVGLLEDTVLGGTVELKGPFYSGLVNSGSYDPKNLSIVVAKGIAVMPVINQLKTVGENLYKFYLDKTKLPEQFAEDYLKGIEYEEINLNDNFESIIAALKNDYSECVKTTGQTPNIMFMASPYFAHRLRESLRAGGVCKMSENIELESEEPLSIDIKKIIMPNHSNLCCGLGICGSCSHTDEKGITVRMCKCMD